MPLEAAGVRLLGGESDADSDDVVILWGMGGGAVAVPHDRPFDEQIRQVESLDAAQVAAAMGPGGNRNWRDASHWHAPAGQRLLTSRLARAVRPPPPR